MFRIQVGIDPRQHQTVMSDVIDWFSVLFCSFRVNFYGIVVVWRLGRWQLFLRFESLQTASFNIHTAGWCCGIVAENEALPSPPPPSTSSYTSKEKLCKWVFLNQCSRLSWTQLGVVPHITMPAWNSIGDDYRTQWYIARVRAVNYDRLRLDPNDRSPSNATAIDFQFHFQFDSQFHFQSQ